MADAQKPFVRPAGTYPQSGPGKPSKVLATQRDRRAAPSLQESQAENEGLKPTAMGIFGDAALPSMEQHANELHPVNRRRDYDHDGD